MKMSFVSFLIVLLCSPILNAAEDLTRREWKVEGVTREALIHVPTAQTNGHATPAPVVFAFHGHGGSMQNAANSFRVHTVWPEAIVVYMQGLNTPGRLTDAEGKHPGWQRGVGDQSDRDLKFFDAVLATLLHDYKVDSKRIYSTGHSNGGSFTYLLWEARCETFAAFAPSAAVSPSLATLPPFTNSPSGTVSNHAKTGSFCFIPKPVLHIAGEKDPLVKFPWQTQMIEVLRRRNECGEGEVWSADKRCTLYKSKVNADVITYIHPGAHNFATPAPEIIVTFFKAHTL